MKQVSVKILVNFAVGGCGGIPGSDDEIPETECCPGSIQESVIVGRFHVFGERFVLRFDL